MLDSEIRIFHKKEFLKPATRALALVALTATLAAGLTPKLAEARWLSYPDGLNPEDIYQKISADQRPQADRLVIPAIKVDAKIEAVGALPDGTMDTPHQDQWNDVGLYAPGTQPGEKGRAVIDGHLDSDKDTAVFWNLDKLKPGDLVQVQRTDGSVLDFTVVRLQSYPDQSFPMDEVFGDSDEEDLNVITCDGVFDRQSQEYNNRLVVYTHLAKDS